MGGARPEGVTGGGERLDRWNVELRHDGGKKSTGQLFQTRIHRFRILGRARHFPFYLTHVCFSNARESGL